MLTEVATVSVIPVAASAAVVASPIHDLGTSGDGLGEAAEEEKEEFEVA